MKNGKLLTAKELKAIEKRNGECVPMDESPLAQGDKDRRDLLEHVIYLQGIIEALTKSSRYLRDEVDALRKKVICCQTCGVPIHGNCESCQKAWP